MQFSVTPGTLGGGGYCSAGGYSERILNLTDLVIICFT